MKPIHKYYVIKRELKEIEKVREIKTRNPFSRRQRKLRFQLLSSLTSVRVSLTPLFFIINKRHYPHPFVDVSYVFPIHTTLFIV